MVVKICGIKREEDALLAAQHGADAVGLLVGQLRHSPDFISPALAARICRALPGSVKAVLVTHPASESTNSASGSAYPTV
jgi:phosphoribosylanthranilate isomerase